MDASRIIQDAIDAFKTSCSVDDVAKLQPLTLKDVLAGTHLIEKEREERSSLCDLRRIELLLEKLENLGKALVRITTDTHGASFIWVRETLVVINDPQQLIILFSGTCKTVA